MDQVAPPPRRRFTVEQYFQMDEESEERLDFRNGEVVAISGGSINHSKITHNIGGELRVRLKASPCEGFDPGVKVRLARRTLYCHPDVTIVCDGVQLDPDDPSENTILNPRLAIEVLSPSTELYDRTKKFERYRSLPSFLQYVLVSQNEPQVETFHLGDNGICAIGPTFRGLAAVVPLPLIGVELPLAEVYDRVTFPPRPPDDES